MPYTVDPITRRKLILVKQLYQQAAVQSVSQQHSTIGRILTVIGFDLAVETALRAVVGSLDTSKTPADGFQGLIQQSDSLLVTTGLSPVPDKANIQYIHSIRNDAQHKAKYPNESDVSDCRTYSRDFLQKLLSEVWGLDFEKISLIDIIQNDEVRQLLVGAATAMAQSEYQQTINQAAAGLTLALNRVERAVVGRFPSFTGGIMLTDSFGKVKSESDARDAYRALERMQDTLLYVTLGMNYADYMKYRQIAGNVIITIDGGHNHAGGNEKPDAQDAEFVLAYSTDTVIQIESRVGSLDAPFGMTRWY
jgi:hypothetical protein